MLFAHLAIDAVEMLFAALDVGVDAGRRQRLADGVEDLADHLAAVAACAFDGLGQHAVTQRMGMAEGQFLQLAVERIQAQAVGDRRIDIERFARDAAPLLGPHGVQRPHVVQAVGQLDQDHAHVARHRQQHLAEIFRLRFLEALVFDAVEFGDAVDQVGGNLAETLGDLGLGDRRVFHHVVQQRGGQGVRVEMPAGQCFGHGQRMRDVGFAADALLAAMGGIGKYVGGADAGDLFGLEVGGDPAVEALQVFGEIDRRMHVRRNQRRFVKRARHHAGVDVMKCRRGGNGQRHVSPRAHGLTCCCG